jgi:DNA (cytosine-5)-methyltransferase 1
MKTNKQKQITIGSLFSGIGGFELGLERAIPNSKTIWQCEQNAFAQKVLKKHWPDVPIYDDIKEIKHGSIDIVDIICGGFPCQDISQAGKGKGIANGDRSGLWFEMLRIIDMVRPRIAIAENVSAITQKGRGMDIVISSLAQIGYDVEWIDVRASDEGAPHKRERIFFVAYANQTTVFKPKTPKKIDRISQTRKIFMEPINRSENGKKNRRGADIFNRRCNILPFEPSNTNHQHIKKQSVNTEPMESERLFECGSGENGRIHERNYWKTTPVGSPLCRMDDGISNRVDRLKALGNAIVPQCSETIGRYIMKSGILDDIEEYRKIQKEINNIPW